MREFVKAVVSMESGRVRNPGTWRAFVSRLPELVCARPSAVPAGGPSAEMFDTVPASSPALWAGLALVVGAHSGAVLVVARRLLLSEVSASWLRLVKQGVQATKRMPESPAPAAAL